MKPSEGIRFANSLIEGRNIVQKVKNNQGTYLKKTTGKLSPGWWSGFMHIV